MITPKPRRSSEGVLLQLLRHFRTQIHFQSIPQSPSIAGLWQLCFLFGEALEHTLGYALGHKLHQELPGILWKLRCGCQMVYPTATPPCHKSELLLAEVPPAGVAGISNRMQLDNFWPEYYTSSLAVARSPAGTPSACRHRQHPHPPHHWRPHQYMRQDTCAVGMFMGSGEP